MHCTTLPVCHAIADTALFQVLQPGRACSIELVPLTVSLIQKILQQQQQQKGATLSTVNKAPLGVTASQCGSVALYHSSRDKQP